jgi:DNA modification methylase
MENFKKYNSLDKFLKHKQKDGGESILNKEIFLEVLSKIEKLNENNEIKFEIEKIINIVKSLETDKFGFLNIISDGDTSNVMIKKEIILRDLDQIIQTQTIERTKYYIARFKKSLIETKEGRINNLNLNRWKEYEDILTDSLWIFDKRDRSGAHNANYWGNFIPQIPNQLLRRFTKKYEWVLDPFLGSGTTLIECKRLGRNGIGVDILPDVVELANKNISSEENIFDGRTEVINADSTELDFKQELEKRNVESVQFLIMHPPYWDIVKFGENKKELSNSSTLEEFLNLFGKVVDNTYDVLDNGRYFAVVIGDKYSNGEWIPLGFYIMNEVLKRKYILKSIIVKTFDNGRGKRSQEELWRYRALVGEFYIFKHEYIFLFKKVKTRNL